ncbi:origin recognition complex subunit 2 protein [Besnoitia besnoiti]|uniref:Origin recognition complex subunit 2 protein n=1 Tax=Besnoitia besnoiti TaxID=94643 RepID=A0A2A9MK98_BESBE|nr:origin recognition complex subunit 2 protein [Besnoitia besnoiti]PFH38349.1 origin recognition complex subunit 2 protein [Besnoitia besnoiti]
MALPSEGLAPASDARHAPLGRRSAGGFAAAVQPAQALRSSPSLPPSQSKAGEGRRLSQHAAFPALASSSFSASFASCLLPSAAWGSLIERRQQEQQQAAYDRELVVAQEAVKAEMERRVGEMREEVRKREDKDSLSEDDEEWLCSQFSGFERVLLRQTVRSYSTGATSSSASSARGAPHSASPRKRKAEEAVPDEREAKAQQAAGGKATGASSLPLASGASSQGGRAAPSRSAGVANGAVWSILLPFSHWLGVSWAPAPATRGAAGGPTSLLVPQLHSKGGAAKSRAGAAAGGTAAGVSPASSSFSFSFSFASKLLERRRRVRQREEAFLLEQERREEEERMKMFERARKRKKRSASAKNASRSSRRGCDAGALSGDEESSGSEEDDEKETDERGDDRRKSEKLERDLNRNGTPSAGASAHWAGSRATAHAADCTRLMAFDFLSCPSSVKLSDEKLPRALLRFLRRQWQKNTEAAETAGAHDGGRRGRGPRASAQDDRSDPVSPRERKLFSEGEEDDMLEEGEDEVSAAIPLLARRVHQRVAQLPYSNQKAKSNLLHYQLATHSLEWKAALLSGYAILVEGFGSKKQLLDLFAQHALRDGVCCVVEGYRREARLQHCLADLLVFLARASPKAAAAHQTRAAAASAKSNALRPLLQPASPLDRGETEKQVKGTTLAASLEKLVKEVRRAARHLNAPLYLVVHNVDAPALRGEARRALAALATCSNIHLICSADHHLHGFLFDSAELRSLNFLHYRCHTYMDYREEVLGFWGATCLFMPLWLRSSAGASGVSARDGGAEGAWVSGVNFSAVVAALTTNHKRLLKCVAERQLEQLRRGEGRAVSLEALSDPLFAMAGNLDRTKILQLLVELTSHGAAIKTSVGGQEALSIRASPAQLEQLLGILEQYGI